MLQIDSARLYGAVLAHFSQKLCRVLDIGTGRDVAWLGLAWLGLAGGGNIEYCGAIGARWPHCFIIQARAIGRNAACLSI